jgi:hypothetical protein
MTEVAAATVSEREKNAWRVSDVVHRNGEPVRVVHGSCG